ncbi:MAG: hypothetical protein ATN31_06755 [Candidatus Epulonipiscioides saccharophilum]|nr:MAG: hypothetical protein ATN31_06755 [Epulopiscium sp. AS2M-Bin001]
MKKRVLQIVVPIAMIIAVSGIWYAKHQSEQQTLDQQASIVNVHPDFSLHTSIVNLDQLKSYGLPIIIDFGADECAPCRQMAPDLEYINQLMQGKAIIKFIDAWKYPLETQKFPVQVIPTQIIFDANGNPYVPSEAVAELIDFDNYANKNTKQHLYTVHVGPLFTDQMLAILNDMGIF